MKQIEIRELDFPGADDESRAALHARLAAELDFPPYYGANLDALNDCLEELDEPLDITFVRASEEAFLRYEELIALCVKEIQALKLEVRKLKEEKE